jgi:hypothetical protein
MAKTDDANPQVVPPLAPKAWAEAWDGAHKDDPNYEAQTWLRNDFARGMPDVPDTFYRSDMVLAFNAGRANQSDLSPIREDEACGCVCDADWTDGTGFCEGCGKRRQMKHE